MTPRTFAGLLRARAQARPDDVAIRFREGESWTRSTWSGLWDQARAAAAALRAEGVRPGDHVLMLVPEVRPAATQLFGVWALGAVPIQVGLPYRLSDVDTFLGRLETTARRLDAPWLLHSELLGARAGGHEAFRALPVGSGPLPPPGAADVHDPDDVRGPAFIQLTSGSTGHPKGVVVPHERAMRHMASMSRALPSHSASSGVSWLPLYHDMGLLGGLLFPFYNGFPGHMMSPLDFRGRPFAWIETMARFRGTICAAPPSAYAIARRQARRAIEAGLDLSAWECAMVGAEPVPPQVLRGFSEAYAPCGFRAEAFFPVYGLAEATVAATFPELLAPTVYDTVDRRVLEDEGRAAAPAPGSDAPSLELVGLGRAIPGSEIRIVDGEGRALTSRRVGEILLRSDTLMAGYYGDPDATASVMRDGWLWTGDLGYLANGHLFVTGRRKELIIHAGRALIPSVLEEIASDVAGVRAGCVAALGIHSERRASERVFVVAETRLPAGEHPALAGRIREALRANGVTVDEVIAVPAGSLPRTTSGKLRRAALAERLRSGEGLPARPSGPAAPLRRATGSRGADAG